MSENHEMTFDGLLGELEFAYHNDDADNQDECIRASEKAVSDRYERDMAAANATLDAALAEVARLEGESGEWKKHYDDILVQRDSALDLGNKIADKLAAVTAERDALRERVGAATRKALGLKDPYDDSEYWEGSSDAAQAILTAMETASATPAESGEEGEFNAHWQGECDGCGTALESIECQECMPGKPTG